MYLKDSGSEDLDSGSGSISSAAEVSVPKPKMQEINLDGDKKYVIPARRGLKGMNFVSKSKPVRSCLWLLLPFHSILIKGIDNP